MFDKLYSEGAYNRQVATYMPGGEDDARIAFDALEIEVKRIEESAVSVADYAATDTDAEEFRLRSANNTIAQIALARQHTGYHNLGALLRDKTISDDVRAKADALLEEEKQIEEDRQSAGQTRNEYNRLRYTAILTWLAEHPLLVANGWLSLRSYDEVYISRPYELRNENPRKKMATHHILHQGDREEIKALCENGDYVFFSSYPDRADDSVYFVLVRRDCVYIPSVQYDDDYQDVEY